MAISSPWPFAQQGIDIIGPLPQGKKQVKFFIIAIDYFTKWVEAKAQSKIMGAKIQGFVWRNIVCRFGIPRTIILDNSCQFDSQEFRTFCSGIGIKNQFSSLGHPQANGQTKVTNQTLLKIIKVQLEGAKGAWLKELPNVLWAYRTTTRIPTEETPFKLTYGIDVVIAVEIGITSMKREHFSRRQQQQSVKDQLGLL